MNLITPNLFQHFLGNFGYSVNSYQRYHSLYRHDLPRNNLGPKSAYNPGLRSNLDQKQDNSCKIQTKVYC